MLKICFAGLGSIGQRHIRNLVKILDEKQESFVIDAVRKGKKVLPEDIRRSIRREYDCIGQLSADYDIFFVTNPTIDHYGSVKEAVAHAKHLFVEKPVFAEPLQSLDDLHLKSDSVYYVACPLRYSSCFGYIKDMVGKEKIYSARSISSSFLPEWRKGSDYRTCYSADTKRGGGVTLDLIHELDYLISLFGMPEKSVHLKGKYSDLEITSDDLSAYILQYADRLVEVHLDYFGRVPLRVLELWSMDHIIRCDFIRNRISIVSPDGREEIIDTGQQDMYMNEMRAFLKMTEGKQENINTLQHANEVLKLALQ